MKIAQQFFVSGIDYNKLDILKQKLAMSISNHISDFIIQATKEELVPQYDGKILKFEGYIFTKETLEEFINKAVSERISHLNIVEID